jgi:hypothetical protein
MTKPTKEIPRFENEAEERKFWESHDSADFFGLEPRQKRHVTQFKTDDEGVRYFV